jgi:Asp-tRNA(Asn)/Glu-tRNA(Gln) amidotransferase A subunit family amidase
MSGEQPTPADPEPDVQRRARRYAERVRGLVGDHTDPAFAPARRLDRPDPVDAFQTTGSAPAPDDGPLADLRVATKDNVAVRGMIHRAGTGGLRWEPTADATVVERLRAAGAEFVGSTRMDAFALGVTGEVCRSGPTANPAVDGAVPGGSSSGSGAAVAAGLADAALGTDTGGSVRVPAAFCGVVAIKPTYDRIPRTGVLDLAPTLDHVGVLARDVGTAARTLDAVAGADPLRPATAAAPGTTARDALEEPLGRLRVGVPEGFVDAASPAVAAAFERAVADLAARPGVTVDRLGFPEHGTAETVNQVHTLTEFAAVIDRNWGPLDGGRSRAMRRAAPRSIAEADVPERVEGLVETGRALNRRGDAYAAAWDARRRLVRRTRACLSRVDVLATPTTPIPAPDFGAVGVDPDQVPPGRVLANTAPFNCTGNPAVSVPCGDVGGRPIGLQVVTPLGEDELALRIARMVQNGRE